MHHGGDNKEIGSYGDFKYLTDAHNTKPSKFFSDLKVRETLKKYLTLMLNRKNTVNGIRYSEDPSILGWQLGNELGGWEGQVPPSDWSIEIAKHIKSIAKNTLVIDGGFGGHNFKQRIPKKTLESTYIDCHFNHYYYGESDYPRIDSDSSYVVDNFKKAFIITEFGFDHKFVGGVTDKVVKSPKIAGALAWSLRYRARDGGYYSHSEGDNGFLAYHLPPSKPTPNFSHQDEQKVSQIMIQNAAKLSRNIDTFKVPVPLKAEGESSPNNLTWFGSAWATSYKVYRYTQGTNNTHYDYMATVKDLKPFGQPLFSDNTVKRGNCYIYKIRAIAAPGFEATKGELKLGPYDV